MTAGAAPCSCLKSHRVPRFSYHPYLWAHRDLWTAVFNAPQEDWSSLNEDDYAQKLIRQGVRFQVLEDLEVMDPETMRPVPRDGETPAKLCSRETSS